ncbi:hypothetical protein MMC06_006415 [Schaereria dolodes]|nr:hypothetical protein [Schaereria dolodes]
MRPLRAQFRQSLSKFGSSPTNLLILRTLPLSPHSSSPPPPPRTLYVLDSSFNPPTLAHLRLATSALLNDRPTVPSHNNNNNDANKNHTKRLLLLLATINADKAPKPASFEHRLVMMTIFAQDLLDQLPTNDQSLQDLVVDVGITKEPYYVDKACAIAESGVYTGSETGSEREPGGERGPEQVHLLGFDSIVRLLDPKYYPPKRTLEPLEGLFARHRLRVTYRTDDSWGARDEQEAYLGALREGKREAEGGKREWADRIEMVEGRKGGEQIVSSTKVREAAKRRDGKALENLLTRNVASWVTEEGLYMDDE